MFSKLKAIIQSENFENALGITKLLLLAFLFAIIDMILF